MSDALRLALSELLVERLRECSAQLVATGPASPETAGERTRVGEEVRDLGWGLGMLGAVAGADVLGDRRVPEGPELVAGWIARLVEREGRCLVDPVLRARAPEALAGWRWPWTVASVTFACAGSEPVAWELDREGDAAVLRWSEGDVDTPRRVLEQLPPPAEPAPGTLEGSHAEPPATIAPLEAGWVLVYAGAGHDVPSDR